MCLQHTEQELSLKVIDLKYNQIPFDVRQSAFSATLRHTIICLCIRPCCLKRFASAPGVRGRESVPPI